MGAEAVRRLRTAEGPEPGDEPTAEPMRAQRRGRSKPSREDLRVRNRTRRSYETPQARTAALRCLACGCTGPAADRCAACGSLAVQANWETALGHGTERQTDWDDVTQGWNMDHARIHRAITLHPSSDVYDKIEDPDVPDEEKAQHLLSHLQNGGRSLGRHWSTDLDHAKRVARDEGWSAIGNNSSDDEENEYKLPLSVMVHAKFPERHHIETDPSVLEEHHVTPWGGSEHFSDESEVPLKPDAKVHVTGLSWSTKTNPHPSEWTTHRYDKDTEAHEQAQESARQERMDNLKKSFKHEGKLASGAFHAQLPPDAHARVVDESRPAGERAKELLDHLGQGHGSIHWSEGATSMPLGQAKMSANALHRKTGSPAISGELRGVTPEGTTKYDAEHGLSGINLPIHAMRWQESAPEHPYKSTEHEHEFGKPMTHQALVLDCEACGHMSRTASSRCRACGSLALKTATVLMTQIERANPGDQMRTPQGQSVHVKKIRPHETDNTKVYVDTDLGTAVMSRGTEVNLTQGERQQELPNSGNPSGNAGMLPGAGRTPTGEGDAGGGGYAAPRCPRDGTKMVQRGNTWICPIDNTTAPLSSAPAGMQPTNRETGQILTRSPGRKPPQTHLWATYHTAGQPPAIVRRARQVLDTMEEIRS
jgi:hypothetical protein